MSVAVLAAFNLLLNGVGSFVAGVAVARAGEKIFRVEPGPAHVALSALPFAKIAFDLARGIPADSFFWMRARQIPQELGTFRIGLGVRWVLPAFDFVLGARYHGRVYGQSLADILATWLTKKVSPAAPAAVVAILASVAAVRLLRRALDWWRAWRSPRRGEILGVRRVGRRRVPVHLVPSAGGAPFTSGVLSPYVSFPKPLYDRLGDEEREAAILHELGHVARHDLAIATTVGVVEDLFWFVPGLARAGRRLRLASELAADAWAVRRGTSPEALASALVRCGELLRSSADRALFARHLDAPPLAVRVRRLLDPSARARWGFQYRLARPLILAWIGASALSVVFFGNH